MSKPMRSRSFSIRVQISKAEQDAWMPQIKADVLSYPTRFEELIVGGPEVAPSTQMRHVHIYVAFEYQKLKQQVIKLLHLESFKPWFEVANKNDRERIIAHHLKETTKEDLQVKCLLRFPQLNGEPRFDDATGRPAKRAKMTGDEFRDLVESGDLEGVKQADYRGYLRMKGSIEAEIAKFRPKTPDVVHEHLWIMGETGTGKTAYIKNKWPDSYLKDCCNANFEEYNNEPVVILDDFDNKRLRLMTVGKLKNLCNPAGDRCKINYGTVHVKARIIVTSQYSIKECFKHKGKAKFIPHNSDPVEDDVESDPDYQAIKRRFREMNIKKLLFEDGIQLKSKSAIRNLTPEQQAAYDVFEPWDPEHNREADAYSECNQSTFKSPSTRSTRSTRTIGTQTNSVPNGSSKGVESNIESNVESNVNAQDDPKYRIMGILNQLKQGTYRSPDLQGVEIKAPAGGIKRKSPFDNVASK